MSFIPPKIFLSIVFFLSLVIFLPFSASAQEKLSLNSPLNREIKSNQFHEYKISVAANQFLSITVEQKGVDVSLNVFDGEKKISESNLPKGSSGLEVLYFISKKNGEYRLELKSANQGNYEIEFREARPAIESDKVRILALKSFEENLKLQNLQNPNDLPKLAENYQKILADWQKNNDKIGEAITLLQLGQTLVSSGEIKESVEYYSKSLKIWQDLRVETEITNVLNARCYANYRMNEYQKALEDANIARKKYQELGDKVGENELLMLIGNLYSELGKYDLALDLYNQALKNWEALKNFHRFAATLNNIGFVYRDSGDWEKAFEFQKRALQVFRDDRPNTRGEANVLNQIGFYYLKKNDLANAILYFQQAIPIWQKITDAFGEPVSLYGMGEIYEKQNEFGKAVEAYNQALVLAKSRQAKSLEAAILQALARIEQKLGNLDGAKQKIESAISIIEATRAAILNQQFRTFYFARSQTYYDFYIQLLMQMHEKSPDAGFNALALEANERAKARSLVELLTLSKAEIYQGIEPSLLEIEQNLQLKINTAEQNRFQMVLRKAPIDQLKTMDLTLQKILTEYEDLQAQIRLKSPRYAVLNNLQNIKTTEIQSLLDEKTVLLEYALAAEKSYLWVVSAKSVKSFVLPSKSEVETIAKDFYQKLKSEETSIDSSNLARKLSEILIKPAIEELENKRLLIVADGALNYIPFAALTNPKFKVQPQKSGILSQAETPLIFTNEILNLPSATVLSVLRKEIGNRKQSKKTIAVIADPVFSRDDLRVKPTNNPSPTIPSNFSVAAFSRILSDTGANFQRLPGSRKEAIWIRDLVSPNNSKISLDFEASRQTVFSQELQEYKIIHFATHGIIDSQQPEFSGIALSSVTEKGEFQDGFLRLYETFNLKLSADLVVLSACETGLGKDVRGEGLIGLTRGFMYAGAKRVAVSLWKVDDHATAELMKSFYQNMLGEKKLSPSAALREAQITMWKSKRFSVPYFWASFTIQGEWK